MTTDSGQLRRKAIRGLKLATAATAGKTVLDMLGQLALARILLPEHFGVFATAQALTGFVSCFSDMAGLKFLIRRKESDHAAISSVFWFELVLGLMVSAAWLVLCVPVLTAMGKPEQIPFAQALTLWILAERLMLPRALHDRAMRFGPVNLGLLIGVVAGVSAMLTAALMGAGAWSFIVGLVVRTIVAAGWMWHAAKFRPLLRIERPVIRELLGFGGPLLLTTAITFAYTNIDYLIVGTLAGDVLLGIYYAAYRYPHYLIQFNIILASVVFPTFSKATDDTQIARGLHLVTRYSGCLGFAAMVAMWMEGDTLILWLLGDPQKWSGALFPFQCFTTLAGLRLTYTHWGHYFVVHGRTKPLLWASIFNLPAITLVTWLGVQWTGINGAAIGVTAVSFGTIAFCCFVLLKRALKFSYLESLAPVFRATLVSAVVFLVLKYVTPHTQWAAALRLVLGMGTYAGVIWVLCGKEMMTLLRNR